MRLYVVSGSYHPEVGGPSTYLRRLLPELIERGHHVSVITYTDAKNSGIDDGFPYPVYRVSRSWPLILRLVLFTINICLLYTSPSPRDGLLSRMPSSA